MKSLRKKFVIAMLVCLSVLIGSFAGLLLKNQNLSLYAANDVELIVAKVKLFKAQDDGKYYAFHYNYVRSTDTESSINKEYKNYYIYDSASDRYIITSINTSTNGDSPSALGLYERENYKVQGNSIINQSTNKYVDLVYAEEVDFDTNTKSPFLKSYTKTFADNLDMNNVNHTVEKNNAYNGSWIQSISDYDNIFMLKNANIELKNNLNILFYETDTDGHVSRILGDNYGDNNNDNQVNFEEKEFLLVQFDTKATSSTILSLSINAELYDIDINPRDKISTESVVTYSQLYDLKNTAGLSTNVSQSNLEPFDEYDAQGHYTFTFTYNIRNNGIVTTNNKLSSEFYLLSENYYINPNFDAENNENPKPRDNVEADAQDYQTVYSNNKNENNKYTEPRLFNTERIDKKFYATTNDNDIVNEHPVEKDFFNYTNQFTTDYDGIANYVDWSNPSENYLKYPTIKYDATRYNLNYEKTMSGITTSVTSALVFDENENAYKLVLTYTNPTKSWTKTLGVEQKNGQQIATVVFEDVGTYVFDFDYVLNGTIFDSNDDMLFVKSENWHILHTNELTIFGYQLMHSEYYSETGATEKEMKDVESSLYADITNANIDIIHEKISNKKINDPYYSGDSKGETAVSTESTELPYVTYSKITTTNQAPLFFKYYSSLIYASGGAGKNSFYYFYKKNNNTYTLTTYQSINESSTTQYPLTSNTRFTESGLYFVFLTYTYPGYEYLTNDNGNWKFGDKSYSANKVQIFAFEIENIEPNISFYSIDGENKTELATGSYTNKSVEINWEDALKSPFDVKPKITVLSQAFGSDKIVDITNRFLASDLAKGKIAVSQSNFYYVKVEYGPCTYNNVTKKYDYSASITYSFTIDKEPIDNIKAYNITGQQPVELFSNITNKNFALVYGNITTNESNSIIGDKTKNSGAKIYVNYSYLPISNSQAINNAPLNEIANNYVYIANGTLISKINKNIIYSSDGVNGNLNSTSKNVLSSDGIYIFTFVDEAGNTATKFVTKDTSKPVLLQYIDGGYSIIPSSASNEENMVNLDTTIVWGTHKAIKIDESIIDEDLFDDGNTLIDILSGEYKSKGSASIYESDSGEYLCVALSQTVNSSPKYEEIPAQGITVYYINENGHYMTLSSNIEKTNKTYKILAVLENEHIYKIRIYDTLGNKFEGKVEMSFDKSALQAEVSGLPSNNKQVISSNSNFLSVGDGSSQRLEPNTVSNKKTISFSWIAGEGDFAVKSVVCEFYPLTFETNIGDQINSNYPYASNYSDSFDLTKNTSFVVTSSNVNGVSVMTTRTKTSAINLVPDSRYGESSSVQGMYKIIRTYQNSGEEPRVYYFYIDRNNLISSEMLNETNHIGDEIKVVLAENSNLYEFAGQDFLQEFVFDYIFKTNKQPANITVPLYKYYFKNISTDLIDNSKIAITRLHYDLYVVYENSVQYIDTDNSLNSYNILSYTATNNDSSNNTDNAKHYSILVRDNTFASDNEDEQYYNSIQFGVAVELHKPEATFIDNETSVALTNSSDNHYSKNDTNVSLVWSAIDDNSFTAKIDENNIKITQIYENFNKTTLYNIENGTVKTNPLNISLSQLIVQNGNQKVLNLNNFHSRIDGINCRIEIELKYKTDNPLYYKPYLSSTKIVYFDFEKPKENYEKELFKNDKYLSSSNISLTSFNDYNSIINYENYAFVVPFDFTFKVPQKDDFWQMGLDGATTNLNDVKTRWIRKYDKYENDNGLNQQSIVPGDDRYDDPTKAPTRLRFNENLQITKDNIIVSAYSIMSTTYFEESGYYEIIEQDCAGNYRIYSIYVLPEGYDQNTETIDYNIKVENSQTNETWTQNETWAINSTNAYIEIDNQKLEFTKFNNLGNWLLIDVLNGSTNTKLCETLKVAPLSLNGFVDIETAISTINNLIADENKTGKYFVITIKSAMFSNIKISYHTPGQKYQLDTVIRSTSLLLTIDPMKYGGSTYLKTLVVEEINNRGDATVLTADSNGKLIKTGTDYYSVDDETISYIFTYSNSNVRNLWFYWTDNFGISYTKNEILGITQTPFDSMLVFSSQSVKNNNYNYIPATLVKTDKDNNEQKINIKTFDAGNYAEYYTNGQVLMEYQPKLYNSITVYKFTEYGELYEVHSTKRKTISIVSVPSRNIERMELITDPDEMGDIQYIVVFTDTSGNYYQYSIHYYNKYANLDFIDSSNISHDFDPSSDSYESAVTRYVYLSYNKYDQTTNYPIATNVSVVRQYTGSDNIEYTQNYGVVNNEFVFTSFGTYIITATNELGATKIYTFQLVKTDASYFTVKADQNGKIIILSPSSVQYMHTTGKIDHYISIYDTTVDVNQEKQLLIESSQKVDNYTTVYHIIASPTSKLSYSKYFAVTKITTTSNIMNGAGSLTAISSDENDSLQPQNQISKKYFKTNAKKVNLTLPKYFEDEANLLNVRVIYNNINLGKITQYDDQGKININFTTAGRYYIYIEDLAGNKQSFLGTAYFELLLINDFSYKLNGQTGIYNSVFNNSVTLSVDQKTNFVTDSNGNYYTISALRNGYQYNPSYTSGSYVFSDYGTYIVKLHGYINRDTDGNLIDEVDTEIKFTILNKNEAKTVHEYIGLNGYEVVKILKNGNDITLLIAEKLGVATINRFALSSLKDGIGGSGNYDITVVALVDKIIGEKQFTYSVWLNNETDVLIIPSIAEGDSTTKNITIKLNTSLIYSQVGECVLKSNGVVFATINATTATNAISTYTLTENARYNITLETSNGNVISSFVVTKTEPLNTIAIIVIVVVSVVAVTLTVSFILLRKKMRIR